MKTLYLKISYNEGDNNNGEDINEQIKHLFNMEMEVSLEHDNIIKDDYIIEEINPCDEQQSEIDDYVTTDLINWISNEVSLISDDNYGCIDTENYSCFDDSATNLTTKEQVDYDEMSMEELIIIKNEIINR